MFVTLENSTLRAEVDSFGAELVSVFHKETGRECLWQADPQVWPRHAPVLFPYCGRLKDDRYLFDGKEYFGKQHGFARDMPHKLVCRDHDIVVLRLEHSAETLLKYPYQFALKTTYQLQKNTILCKHKVISYSSVPMYFSIGFHTGLACPFVPGTQPEEYRVVFEQKETMTRLFARPGGLFENKAEAVCFEHGSIPVTKGGFSDSLVLKDIKSSYIQLEEKASGDYIRIRGTDSPYTVIWSAPEDDTKLLCIEPWYGIGDSVDAHGDLTKKQGIICLGPKEEFTCAQIIEIGMGKNK